DDVAKIISSKDPSNIVNDEVAKITTSKDPSKALAKYLTESKWTGRVSQRRITETVLRTLLL
ncbi:hypothetical protein KIPB_015038, partial [Kipferlia bialata]